MNACVLTNTSEGYGWTYNLTVNAEPIKNLNLMAAYTHTVMKEMTGMPGNNAYSTWANMYTVEGPNFLKLSNSRYVIPDRIIASATSACSIRATPHRVTASSTTATSTATATNTT